MIWSDTLEVKFHLEGQISDLTDQKDLRRVAFETLYAKAREILDRMPKGAYMRDLRVSRIFK